LTTTKGLEKLLKVWRDFKAKDILPRGMAPLRDAFLQLHDMRFWGAADRIKNTGLLEDWIYRLEDDFTEIIPFEVELWYRDNPADRRLAEERIKRIISDCEGIFSKSFVFEEIRYHGLLGHLQRSEAAKLVECLDGNDLLRCDDVMFFRPLGQCLSGISDIESEDEPDIDFPKAEEDDFLTDNDSPIIALLDGYPFANHKALKDRLVIDDPDDFLERYSRASEFCHGTEMASLILHGDLEGEQDKDINTRKIYTRPIMAPSNTFSINGLRQERVPEDVLPLDVVHRAVRRLFESENGEPPAAPFVKIINLSVGDMYRLFDTDMSPWAKMLDWLSYTYNVLFVVSAGNHSQNIVLEDVNEKIFSVLSDLDKEKKVLEALNNKRHSLRMMSPAESVNALSVKAYHSDNYKGDLHYNLVEPIATPFMVSPFSPITLGKNKSVKPEIMMPGGRQTYRNMTFLPKAPIELSPRSSSARGPGHKVACPGPHEADISRYHYTTGTSNAAALTTRRLAFLYETLSSMKQDEDMKKALSNAPDAVILKAMIIHGAEFHDDSKIRLADLFKSDDKSKTFKSDLNQFLGYGGVDEERIHACTDQQATLLHTGVLEHEEAHSYRFPLPDCLSASSENRRIIVTVAWFSPTNPNSIIYNGAKLWVSGANKQSLKVPEGDYFHSHTENGTAFHKVYSGSQVSDLSVNDFLDIQVNCRERAGVSGKKIPYALIVTVDAPRSALPIYSQVKVKLKEVTKVSDAINTSEAWP